MIVEIGVNGLNDWYEVDIISTFEYSEVFEQIFLEEGAGGVVVDDPALQSALVGSLMEADEPLPFIALPIDRQVVIKGYFNKSRDIDSLIVDISEKASVVLGTDNWSLKVIPVHEEDWAHAWKQYFHSFKTGGCFRVIPSWEREEVALAADEIPIFIDPGMAFGTGTHPTTALCIDALCEMVKPGMKFIDIGTGSGILAIAAAKLGASGKALDIDPVAVETATRNILDNGVDGFVDTFLCDITNPLQKREYGLNGSRFDLVVANIVAEVLVRLMPTFSDFLHAESKLLLSGIIDEKLDSVFGAARAAGLEIIKISEHDDWRALVVSGPRP